MNLLKVGITSEEVKNLQLQLNEIGLNAGEEDGIFGNGTKKAVKELQNIFGLSSDGIVGKSTYNLLAKLQEVKNFKLDEFRCRCCKALKLNIDLLLHLEKLREKTGPLVVNSGYRCPVHNRNVGGARASQHLKGTAADLRGVNMSPSDVHAQANNVFYGGGVGKYRTFTHVDVRGHKSRW